MRRLKVLSAGPAVTVQDLGRSGTLAYGLSRGGAADRLALAEGAALLGQDRGLAAIEMAGTGGRFQAEEDLRIALTGAPMRARIGTDELRWNACHLLPAGAVLDIGAATSGAYGYLHLGGGVAIDPVLGARATHLGAGLGQALAAGDVLPAGRDPGGETGLCLPPDDRFAGGTLRVVPSLQTGLFPEEHLARFTATTFRRDARANRMGVRLTSDGAGFHVEGGLSVVSEVIVPGDVQVTGDGTPFVLLAECQTTGGYPRIATVIPPDLPRVAQAPAGAALRFAFVTLDEAVALERQFETRQRDLVRQRVPLIRDPSEIADLLSYQLISGATAGRDLEEEET